MKLTETTTTAEDTLDVQLVWRGKHYAIHAWLDTRDRDRTGGQIHDVLRAVERQVAELLEPLHVPGGDGLTAHSLKQAWSSTFNTLVVPPALAQRAHAAVRETGLPLAVRVDYRYIDTAWELTVRPARADMVP